MWDLTRSNIQDSEQLKSLTPVTSNDLLMLHLRGWEDRGMVFFDVLHLIELELAKKWVPHETQWKTPNFMVFGKPEPQRPGKDAIIWILYMMKINWNLI